MSGRHLPAFGISAIAHASVFLILTLTLHQASESQFIPAQSDENIPPQAHLVWLAVPGDGGGGGGGNQMREPPRQIQRRGREPVSVPSVTPSRAPAAAEPAVEQTIEAPVLPSASAEVTVPGGLDPAALAMMSLGPGSGDGGAGAGDRRGIGAGRGNGLGPGGGDGAGGPNGRGARIVLPTVLRDVKPRYTPEAMRARVEGAVVVSAIVQADGTVRDVQVVRSLDPLFGLDQAAVNAARQWLFRPGLMAGLVPVADTIELSFNLR